MLVLKHYKTKEDLEFENSTSLIEFLKMQNPSYLKSYINQFKLLQPTLKITGIGPNIRIKKI